MHDPALRHEVGSLDVVLAHEIGHTAVASGLFGYKSFTTNRNADEFNAVRHVENPYRQSIGLPLRTHYSGTVIPPPLIER